MPRRYRFLTIGSLSGLTIGFVLGLIVYHGYSPFIGSIINVLDPVEGIWIDVLRVIVLPLIVSYLVLAITAAVETRVTGKIGGIAVAAHVILLIVVTLFTITVGPAVLTRFPLSQDAIEAFQESTASGPMSAFEIVPSTADQDVTSVPARIYSTIVSVDIIAVLVIATLFAIVLARIRERYRMPILAFFKVISKASLTAVDVLLLFMPLVIVVVTYNVTVKVGGRFVGTLGYWVVLISSLLVIATLALYAVSIWVGRVRLHRFARALLPVQILAFASRSSIVCLPKLVDAGRDGLEQPEHITGIVLPLSVSTFKLNRMVSTPMKLFFLVHLYGIELDPTITASLIFTAMILSFATPGIPSGGKFTTLPIYLAAGIPIEGVVLLKAVDAIPDIFKTIINVSEDLTIATIVARFVQAGEKSSALEPAFIGPKLSN